MKIRKKIAFFFLLCFNFCFSQTKHYDSLIGIAEQAFNSNDYGSAAVYFNRAFDELGRKGTPKDRYAAAISWAMLHESDSSFLNLYRLADKTNYLEFHLLIAEKRFEYLHEDSRWNELLKKINPLNENYNDSLSKILLSISESDQKYRMMLDAERRPYAQEASDSFKSILKMMRHHDSLNLLKVISLIDSFGWLSPNQVGREANSALWLVIQHSDLKTQLKYFPMMEEAVKNGKALRSHLAYLEDRILMNQGKKQRYGTQYKLNETSKRMEIWSVEDPINLNKRRESVGLPPM